MDSFSIDKTKLNEECESVPDWDSITFAQLEEFKLFETDEIIDQLQAKEIFHIMLIFNLRN